jgi:hypothetical protein
VVEPVVKSPEVTVSVEAVPDVSVPLLETAAAVLWEEGTRVYVDEPSLEVKPVVVGESVLPPDVTVLSSTVTEEVGSLKPEVAVSVMSDASVVRVEENALSDNEPDALDVTGLHGPA